MASEVAHHLPADGRVADEDGLRCFGGTRAVP